MGQWQRYEHQYETLSQWLKDTEVKIRSETTLKPDLAGKREQLEFFRVSTRQHFYMVI